MASIIYSGSEYWPEVKCSGCGETRNWLPPMLDSRIRSVNKFDREHAKQGTTAGKIAEFAREHSDCPEPRTEISNGIVVVNKRKI